MRAAGIAAVVLAAFCLPAGAAAHVGRTIPVATDYVARITSLPAGIRAKVIDGDQSLWLDVSTRSTVVVLGFSGEAYLRFTASGVQANKRSATWLLNRAFPGQTVPHTSPRARPLWETVSRGHAYRWHEDRLHGLALAARTPGSQFVGTWTVPLRIDGRRAQIRGSLRHVNPPSLLWLWPAIVLVAALPALLRLRRRRLNAAIATTLILVDVAAIAVATAGRLLYGRPAVSLDQQIELILTAAALALVLRLLILRPWQTLAVSLTAAIGFFVGLAWIGTLEHGHVNAAIPDAVERGAIVVMLGAGLALLAAVHYSDTFHLALRPGRAQQPRRKQPDAHPPHTGGAGGA